MHDVFEQQILIGSRWVFLPLVPAFYQKTAFACTLPVTCYKLKKYYAIFKWHDFYIIQNKLKLKAMPDNKTIRDGRDRSKIDINDASEVEFVHQQFPHLSHEDI